MNGIQITDNDLALYLDYIVENNLYIQQGFNKDINVRYKSSKIKSYDVAFDHVYIINFIGYASIYINVNHFKSIVLLQRIKLFLD